MDRAQLKFLLHSGPSRIFDVRKLQFDAELSPLFKIGPLNSAILIKQSPPRDWPDAKELPPIANLIYLPYDRARPEDGGESFYFTPANVRGAFVGHDADNVGADIDLLSLFNKVPTFSPYLIKDILERADITIPEGYFTLPERESMMIKQRMQARLRPLVATAFGSGDKAVSDSSIEHLVQKLWELKDLEELQPLIQAFRISIDDAPEVFYCWLGIAFFENEYIKLQPDLKTMAEWLSKGAIPRDPMPTTVLEHLKHTVTTVRRLMQQHWKSVHAILHEYSATYEELVGPSGSAQHFIEFLRPSKTHFWTLGGCLGRLDQSVEIWRFVNERNDHKPLNFEQSVELFGILNSINKPDQGVSDEPKLAAAAS
jgi:hypothetical protein